MRRFGDRDMWAARNQPTDARQVALQPSELPLTSVALTEGSGARMSELTPLFLTNQGGMVMTTASDYGTLHAAGRP